MAEKNEVSPLLPPGSKWYVLGPRRLSRWSLSRNSFRDARNFFRSTEVDDIRLDFSSVDKRTEAQDENDLIERRNKSLDSIVIVVRHPTHRFRNTPDSDSY